MQERIVPIDRQNIGQILRDNGLKEYDEYELLMLANGRCAQDECCLVPVKESDLPKDIKKRLEKKIEYVIAGEQYRLIVFFRNGKTKIYNANREFEEIIKHNPRYADRDVFTRVKIMPGGYGLTWGSVISITDEKIYREGKSVPLSIDDFAGFVKNSVLSSAQAAEYLDCSRQNIDDLIKRDKLHPINTYGKNKLLFRDEVIRRTWE